jgi:molybdate transport system substrate-binding protein
MKPFQSCVLLVAALAATPLWAEEVQIAVAANFTAPMEKIAAAFERDTGHMTRLTFGSTGKLYAQIKNGAPFQVLLAADEATPAKLQREGLGVEGSRFTYAIGRLVLWSTREHLVDPKGRVLATDAYDRLAIANPKLAPYGAAAINTLTRLGLLAAIEPRFVQGENIAQTYQFVATGNADLGFVALSQVWKEGQITAGSAWLVPADLHAPIRQDAVILSRGAGSTAAQALMAYLNGDGARTIIRAYGYDL